jgi:hypothetical protein
MIIRMFTGQSWASAAVFDDAEFDLVPRKGEKLAIEGEEGWAVATVVEVAHRVTGGGAADVALLVGPVMQIPASDDVLPFAALDGDGVATSAGPRTANPIWGR